MTHSRSALLSLALAAFAAPLCSAQTPAASRSLYDRLGGEAAIRKVVDDFVATAAPDPKVNFSRSGAWKASDSAVAALKDHLVAFMAQAFGGPKKYAGRSMKEAHRGMAITQAEFDALAGHLKAAMAKNKVPAAEMAEAMAIAASTAPDIVEK